MIRKGQIRWVAGDDLTLDRSSSSTISSIWQPEHTCRACNNLSAPEGCNTAVLAAYATLVSTTILVHCRAPSLSPVSGNGVGHAASLAFTRRTHFSLTLRSLNVLSNALPDHLRRRIFLRPTRYRAPSGLQSSLRPDPIFQRVCDSAESARVMLSDAGFFASLLPVDTLAWPPQYYGVSFQLAKPRRV